VWGKSNQDIGANKNLCDAAAASNLNQRKLLRCLRSILSFSAVCNYAPTSRTAADSIGAGDGVGPEVIVSREARREGAHMPH
jgi:hypothetical protein